MQKLWLNTSNLVEAGEICGVVKDSCAGIGEECHNTFGADFFSLGNNPPTYTHDDDFKNGIREPDFWDKAEYFVWEYGGSTYAALKDMDDALPAYEHFLKGKGKDKEFSFDEYVHEDPSGELTLLASIRETQKYAQELCKNQNPCEITSKIHNAGIQKPENEQGYLEQILFPYPSTENWQKTIGSYKFHSNGKVTMETKGDQKVYTMEYTLYAEDVYNFNKDSNDIATGVADERNGKFEETGLAHDYKHKSTLKRKVVWTEGDIENAKVIDPKTNKEQKFADIDTIGDKIVENVEGKGEERNDDEKEEEWEKDTGGGWFDRPNSKER